MLPTCYISTRHLTTPADAVRTFRQRSSHNPVWEEQYRRFVTVGDTHVLYWYWLDEERTAMVVTCFTLEDGQ